MNDSSESVNKPRERRSTHNPSGYEKETVEVNVPAARKSLLNMMVNSTALFILAFIASYLIFQTITKVAAHLAGIHSVLYFYELAFNISNYSPEWTAGRIVLVTASAPVVCMILGIIVLFHVVRRYKWRRYFLMFLLWLGFHLVNMLLGGILAGAITDHGIGYTLDVFFWPTYLMYLLFIFLGVFSLVVVGIDSTEFFLKTTPPGFWSRRKNRWQYLLFTLELPWLIGSILLFLIRYPDHIPQHESISMHDFILTLSLIFLIFPIFLKGKNFQSRADSTVDPTEEKILWTVLIFTVIVVLGFRFGLTNSFYSLVG